MEAIVIGNEKFKAEISPNGAELQQLTRLTDGKNYIWTPIEMFWNRRSPNLFPIVGRLKNNQYLYNGVTYKLDQHGFARNSYFELISQKSNGVILKLKSNSSSMINYPFDFSLTMQFSLVDNVLNIIALINNPSSKILPFSYGGHPAFALNYPMDNYTVRVAEKKEITRRFLNEGIRIDRLKVIPLYKNELELNDSLFVDDAIVLENQNIHKVDLIEKGRPYLTLLSDGNPYYGIWSKPGAPFICLEPWWGIADSQETSGEILEKEGINKLASQSEVRFNYSIEMH